MVINDYVNLEWVKKYSNPVAAMKHCVDKLLEVFFVLFCFVLFFLLTSLMNWNQSYVTELDTGWCKILVLTDQSGKRSIWIVPHPLKQRNIGKKNRMEKTKDLLKKIRDTKQTFHAKMGSIKDRSGLGLKEAEDFKKRWQKYTDKTVQKRYSWPR